MSNIKRSKYNALSGTIKVIDTLNEYRNNCGKGVKKIVRKVALDAKGVAQETLKNADHRQKYGDGLVDQIGVAYKDGVANVYAPITTTREMRNKMYWAEYGTGYHSDCWGYYTTPNDKNPKKRQLSNGKWISVVHESRPAKYMQAARRYVYANLKKEMVKELKIILTRRPMGYAENADKVFKSNMQQQYLRRGKNV